MNTKEIRKKLQEALDAGDLEAAKRWNAKLAEADNGADTEAKGKAKAKPKAKEDEDADEAKTEEVEEAEDGDENDEADEGDGEDEPDEDAELEEAVAATKAEALDEEDDEDADEDADEGDESDDLEEGDEGAGCDEADDMAECGKKGKKGKKMAEAKGPLAKGVGKGGGSLTKKAGGKKFTGRKFGEAADLHALRVENAHLRARLDKVTHRNERLAEALRTHVKADAARKLLKESEIPVEMRAHLVERLVRLPNENAMRREIDFQQRLLESAAKRVREEIADDFTEVEGAGTRFRESYAGDDDLSDLLAGLPTKK